jgi:hypothetical protein
MQRSYIADVERGVSNANPFLQTSIPAESGPVSVMPNGS